MILICGVRPKTANPPKVNLMPDICFCQSQQNNHKQEQALRTDSPTQTDPNTCGYFQISWPCWSRDFAPLPGSNDMWPTGEASAHLRWRQNHRIAGTLKCIASHSQTHTPLRCMPSVFKRLFLKSIVLRGSITVDRPHDCWNAREKASTPNCGLKYSALPFSPSAR